VHHLLIVSGTPGLSSYKLYADIELVIKVRNRSCPFPGREKLKPATARENSQVLFQLTAKILQTWKEALNTGKIKRRAEFVMRQGRFGWQDKRARSISFHPIGKKLGSPNVDMVLVSIRDTRKIEEELMVLERFESFLSAVVDKKTLRPEFLEKLL
jgi:hypothetical protein